MSSVLAARVADYMTRPVTSIAPTTPLREIATLFGRHDFNGLPVLEGETLVGMVTKFDMLRMFLATGQILVPPSDQLARVTAGQIMTRDVITFGPDAPLARVLQTLVDFRVRSFPVVEGARVVGMIAREDLARALRVAAASQPA